MSSTVMLEELRCAICQSLGPLPIRVCLSGQLICGKCEPEGDPTFPPTPVPFLDTFLKNKMFPCKYKESGCVEEFLFDVVREHESKCVYSSINCMFKECSWTGFQIDLQKHFVIKHEDCVQLDTASLPAFGNEDVKGVIVVIVERVLFVIDFKYSASKLQYIVLYVSHHIKDAEYVIYTDEKNETLVSGKCWPLDVSLISTDSKYQTLDTTSIGDNKLHINIKSTVYDFYIIDRELINSYKCYLCMGYLIPSPYDIQQLDNVCGFCVRNVSESSTLAVALVLPKNVKNANFPCRWKFCNFVSNPNKMFLHEPKCRFRVYECLIEEGCAFLDLAHMNQHLNEVHKICYFADTYSVQKPLATKLQLYTIKLKTFVLIEIDFTNPRAIVMKLKTSENRNRIPVYVQFKHEHCNITSKMFCIVSEMRFTREHFPPCFKRYKIFSLHLSMNLPKQNGVMDCKM